MRRRPAVALYVLVLVVVVVGVDVLFFKHHVWERLIANVAIVVVFGAAAYLWKNQSARRHQERG